MANTRECYMVMICGSPPAVTAQELDAWKTSKDREIRLWSELFTKTKSIYEHYRALLEADVEHPDFSKAETEVAETRRVLGDGSVYRGEMRKKGIPKQDVDYEKGSD